MNRPILFSLEHCTKCEQIKELLKNRNDIDIVTFPHDYQQWNFEHHNIAKQYNVRDDLKITAPILCTEQTKIIGYLRIRKYLQDNADKHSIQ